MTSTNNTNRANRHSSTSNNVKKEYIQKLSNDKALAEAILIGKKPSFVIVDFSNPDYDESPKIVIMESLAYSPDTRLVPKLLSDRPYSFKNKEEFFVYVERAKTETLDSLFNKALSIWKKYIDANDFHLKICAADTIFTYFQDKLGMTHYLWFIADNDAGKSNNLKLFNIVGYRNLMNTAMTHANIYNFLGSKDEGVGTICIDEADNIDQYPLMMEILKCGYNAGTHVTRIVETGVQVSFNTYCFKAMACESLPDEVDAKGFMQRVVVIKCLAGFPDYDIAEITSPAGDEEYEDLLNELNDFRNLMFCYRLIRFKDKIPNIKLNIRNREKQLFKPLLRLFQGTQAFNTLRPVISKYINDRRESKANSLHAFIYRQIRNLAASKGLELDFKDIWNFMLSNLDYKDIPYKPQSVETTEFNVISQKQIGSILQHVFGGEPPKHTGSSRRLIFSQHVLDRMKDQYETIDVNVDLQTSENLDDYKSSITIFGTDGTDGTDVQSTPSPSDSEKNEHEDIGALSENVSQVSQVSQCSTTNDKSTNDNHSQQAKKTYADFIDENGVATWDKENRGMTVEEQHAYLEEVKRLRQEGKKE